MLSRQVEMSTAYNFIKNPTVLSIVITVVLVYGLHVPINLILLVLNLSTIISIVGIGYYAYKNPLATVTAYKILVSDVKDVISQLSDRQFNETILSDVKIVTTPSGTHIIPLDTINYIPHTLELTRDDESIIVYNMAENCSYDISPDNVDCKSIIANANGVKIRVNGSRTINPSKIRTKVLA